MPPSYRCWAEIDLDVLRENLVWIRHTVGRGVKIITVVKADAYGHGLKQIAGLLMQSGTDIFGVANLNEADAIRAVGKGWPILMLGACLPDEIERAVKDDVMPTISSRTEAELFSREARRKGKLVNIHIKVDTGMGRLGVQPSEAPGLIKYALNLPNIKIAGLFTHYSAVEDDKEFTKSQQKQFKLVLEQLKKEGIKIPLIHCNNSGGILFEPKTNFNCVRPGLLVYGVIPPTRRRVKSELKKHIRPALCLKCRVSYVKDVPAGYPLSYGHTYYTERPMRIATLSAGYGDGYLRAGSNRAMVIVQGKKCRILGRITMDQMLADVSDVVGVKAGDEVVLIGRQGNQEINAVDVAQWFGTIPYEVLTSITYRVPRIYKGGHAA